MKNVQFKTRHSNILYTAIDTTTNPVIVTWIHNSRNESTRISHDRFHKYISTGAYILTKGKKAISNVRKKKSVNLFSIDEL